MKKSRVLFLILLLVMGFVFVGCKENNADDNKDKEVVDEKDKEKDPEQEVTYNVTFNTNCDTNVEKVIVKSANEITLPALTKEGYSLKGWYTDSEYKNEFKADLELTSDVTLYALWEVNKFKVKFLVNDEVIKEEDVEYGKGATAPTTPTLTGYTFDKWDKDFSSVKDNLEVKAIFIANKYNVKFIVDDEEIASRMVEYGADAVAPSDPELEGYTFVRWDKDFTNVKEDLEVTAIFEAITFTVKFMNDDVEITTITVNYGDDAVCPTTPLKAGYTFSGWDEETENVRCNLVLYAQFEANEYNITYLDGASTLNLAPAKFAYGDKLELPTYTKEDYIFVGWYTDEALKTPFNGNTEIESDLTLRALIVKVDYNGGTSSWTTTDWGSYDPAKGIDPISDLPEYFEKDFFTYLSDNNLLDSSAVGATVKATTWEKFSGVNPVHNGDPQRIWNDCTNNKAQDASDGYMALYLFKSLVVDSDGKLVDIEGGFLGTEPYKTKYFNVMQHLKLLYDGKYVPKNYNVNQFGDNNSARELYAFLLDGWFYGTQGLQKDNSVFDAARKVVPTTTLGYTWNGTSLVSYDNEYAVTTDSSSILTLLAVPFGATEFDCWCIDSECTTPLTDDNYTYGMTIYAKWK